MYHFWEEHSICQVPVPSTLVCELHGHPGFHTQKLPALGLILHLAIVEFLVTLEQCLHSQFQ